MGVWWDAWGWGPGDRRHTRSLRRREFQANVACDIQFRASQEADLGKGTYMRLLIRQRGPYVRFGGCSLRASRAR